MHAVHGELVDLMGPEGATLAVAKSGPTVVLMAGLQGAGKTTTCAQARQAYLKKKGTRRRPLLGLRPTCKRPAAVEQLRTLADQVDSEVTGPGSVYFYGEPDKCAEYGQAVGVAVKVCRNAHKEAAEAVMRTW